MPLIIKPYDLPDASLFGGSGNGMLVWQPAETIIVLGQSNSPERSLISENVEADNIPVTKRPTGGEAVVLSPEMVVITVARNFNGITSSKEFFREVNSLIIAALCDLGVQDLGSKGISDITIGNRKILGSSMHRRDNRLVYHAVLNTGEDTALFERYLQHPGREPDYRSNRKHGEFVTSLREQGYEIDRGYLAELLNAGRRPNNHNFTLQSIDYHDPHLLIY